VEGEDISTATNKTEDTVEPAEFADQWKTFLGHRQPLVTFWAGKEAPFTDGFGLCSLGRLHPTERKQVNALLEGDSGFSAKIIKILDDFINQHLQPLDRSSYKLALGRFTAEKPPFSEYDLQKLRRSWFGLLPDPEAASISTEFQPFWRSAVAQTLKLLGDAD